MLSLFLVLLLALDAGWAVAAGQSLAGEEIEITAGQAEFDPETRTFTGSDGVEIRSGELVIKGGEVVFDPEGWLRATGEVELIHPDFSLRGKELRYNFQEKTGEIEEVTGDMEGTLFSGSRAEIAGSSLSLQDAVFTRCSLSRPDLAFSVDTIRMEDQRMKTSAGWLEVKGLRLLPLPPLNLPVKNYEGWPFIRVGFEKDWSLFFSGNLRHPLLTSLNVSTGATVGANGRRN